MESWLDSTAHDQTQLAMQNSALFRVYRAPSNSRSQRTRIRFSLGREPCPYTQMFRSASIMTRTRSSSVTFASYTSFPRSHVFPPIFSSTIVPINENKDGCSTPARIDRVPPGGISPRSYRSFLPTLGPGTGLFLTRCDPTPVLPYDLLLFPEIRS